MAISIEIIDRGFLDLFGDVVVPITLSVSDIGKIDSRQGAYSTSIDIPRTSNNEKILDYISTLNYNSEYRGTNIRCNLWENATLIKQGFLSITEIGTDIRAVFFGDNVDWFKSLEDKMLTDITFPSEYNHIWNETNIVQGAGRAEGYFYHLHSPNFDQSAGNELISKIDKSRPATFLHSIFYYIFNNIGIKLKGDLFNDSFYKKIILPFNKNRFALTARSAKAKQGTVYLYSGSKTSTFSPDPKNVTYMAMDWGDSDNPDGSPTVGLNNTSVWNNTTKEYTVPFTDTYTISLTIQCDVSLFSSYETYLQVKVNGTPVKEVDRIMINNFPVINCIYYNRPLFSYGEVNGANSPVFTMELIEGDVLTFGVGHSYDAGFADQTSTCQYCTGSVSLGTLDCSNTNTSTLARCQVDTDFLASILQITPSRGDYEGGTEGSEYVLGNGIDLASTLPDIKQTDFVKYVFNLFGVVPQFDVYTKTLFLNKFDNIALNLSQAEDWTSKIDFTNTPNFNLNTIKSYAKKTWFEYSNDEDDPALDNYNNINGVPYGSGFIQIDNDFLEDEKTIYSAPFSASTINSSTGCINLLDESDSPKIAFISGGQVNDITINGVNFAAYNVRFDTTQGLDSSFSGSNSLSFGMPVGYTAADTGVLNRYYKLKSNMLNKPVLLKILMKLNEVDIININYTKPKILTINGETLYYVLNKIDQYKGDGSSTECEFLLINKNKGYRSTNG